MKIILLFLIVFVAVIIPTSAKAQVVWEDYQGTADILGTSNQNKPGPSYINNGATRLPDLRAISVDISNATRTGTSANIEYRQNLPTLCNTINTADSSYDPAGTGAACQADAQGRVIYALVKFPETGNYTFSFAHDDDIDVDFSSDYTNVNYRNASYDLPVGTASSFTNGDTNFENIAGIFSSPTANACILLRVYWNNGGGRHFLRMRWTKPSGTVEIVPASQFFNPGVAASATGCTSTVVSAATSIQLKKTISTTGRAGSTDQFALSIVDSTNNATAANTQTIGTDLQASTGATPVVNGRSYLLAEQIVAGSGYTLAAYTPTIACTRSGTPFTPGGSAPTWSVATTAVNQQIVCTITNTRKSSTLRLQKTWVGAVLNDSVTLPATTGFTANTTALVAVANAANETDGGASISVLVGDSGTLGAESFTVGTPSAYQSVLSCSGATPSGSNGQSSNILVIPETAAGLAVTCTYTNSYRTPLTISKISTVISDPVSGTANPKAIPNALISYCILISNPGGFSASTIVATDPLSANVAFVPASIKSGASCTTANIVEDDDASAADESDPYGASVSGTTLTFVAPNLAASASVAFIFRATVE